MATLRRGDVFDLFAMQNANLINLPENYIMKYYFFHAVSWPQLLSVSHDSGGKLVGYVLAKLEEDDPADRHGHVTSVAVLRQSRKLGLASKLMNLTQHGMEEVFDAEYASLHVRVTNRAAYSLYKHTLGYRIHDVDKEYYADKEDAFSMRNYFSEKRKTKKGASLGPEPQSASADRAVAKTSEEAKNSASDAAASPGDAKTEDKGQESATGASSTGKKKKKR
ncbi:putative N-terminal acetyltransferase complex subunit ARD1 [Neospora caninum Liverpool]|uniref:N-terminal acetyltransferase complex subunit ARD1, putative n=1 Tax=Neospora caninum (strain Liverpool) TaxID=572307 RepID=F0VPL4_NEOCL|nr:putative N-terminal acetyltransferase complex subunit ARD1 [Neospora caninum Liverpool]CBZ55661.1 putative N-terminal acetyltransferase complex subunit ARD1 [Neospora caninum Liverpool]CEL70403.1 TPA: N-terminal acetyltransferase complex subunit ARD1, putative [Neospora caninum Liverpool]|eukprot:XP_003885687.1 putative N-terminal acetyltransferase complex subunit ARD1 [Neospora caninum Liverpool]